VPQIVPFALVDPLARDSPFKQSCLQPPKQTCIAGLCAFPKCKQTLFYRKAYRSLRSAAISPDKRFFPAVRLGPMYFLFASHYPLRSLNVLLQVMECLSDFRRDKRRNLLSVAFLLLPPSIYLRTCEACTSFGS